MLQKDLSTHTYFVVSTTVLAEIKKSMYLNAARPGAFSGDGLRCDALVVYSCHAYCLKKLTTITIPRPVSLSSAHFGLAPRCVTPSLAATLHNLSRWGYPGLPSKATSPAPSTDRAAAAQFHIIHPSVEKNIRRSPRCRSQCSSSSFFCCKRVPLRCCCRIIGGRCEISG